MNMKKMLFCSLLLFFINIGICSAQVCTYRVQQDKTSNLSKIEIDMSMRTVSGYNALSGQKNSLTLVNQDVLDSVPSTTCIPYVFEARMTSTYYRYYVVANNDVFDVIQNDIKSANPTAVINAFYCVDNIDEALKSEKEIPIYIKEAVFRTKNRGVSYEYHETNDVVKISKDQNDKYKIDKNSKYVFKESNTTVLIADVLSSDENVFVCIAQLSDRTGEKNGKYDCEVSKVKDLEDSGYSLTDDRGNPVSESETKKQTTEKSSAEEITYNPEDDLSKEQLENAFALCKKKSYRTTLKIVGWFISIVRIIVPVLIIVFGLKDLYTAVTGSKEDGLIKAIRSLIVRLGAGVLIFLLPGIVQYVINMVSTWGDEGYQGNFSCCTDCALNFNCDSNSQCKE